MTAPLIDRSRRHLSRGLTTLLAGALAVAGLGTAAPAGADTAPPASVPVTASADPLPTVQVDGVVWKTEVVGRTAYAVGSFTTARPAGTPLGGAGEVPRANVLAFDVVTGALLPFAPVLNAQALTVQASPDGSKLYVAGDFTTVDGVVRSKIAAFDTGTGALEAFRPGMSSRVRALAVTDTTVYAGGDFLGVNGVPRTRLAALSRPHGVLLDWAPTADDDSVEALAAAPDDSRVVVGGRFQTLNGQDFVGVGAVDGRTGATQPWSAKVTPAKKEVNGVTGRSWVTDLVVQDGVVYGSNNGDGFHWFDGRWAASFATGDLVWLDNCYGATYGVLPRGQVLYSVGHPHDCSSVGAFPETNPVGSYRAVAETTYPVGIDTTPPSMNSTIRNQPVPQLLHWFPEINAGTFTGQNQGSWAIDGNSEYIVIGGEFTRVNGIAQQGLVRFAVPAIAPNKSGPVYSPTLLPSALSLEPGSVRVAWPATWDRDNAALTYTVHRDDKVLVHSEQRSASAWTPSTVSRPTAPSMGFTDTGLQPGAVHRYKLMVKDAFGNTLDWMRTPQVTVAGSGPSAYPAAVRADGATSYWRFGETTGDALDHAGYDDVTKGAEVLSAPGAIVGDPDAAGSFSGRDPGFAVTEAPVASGDAFSLEAWVRTTSTSGGKIVGYASNVKGLSVVHDRHLYLTNTGSVVFGLRTTTGAKTVASAAGLADGAYHHVVGTFSPSTGMVLYVDGKRVASQTGLTPVQAPLGYWRIGGDNLDGWAGKPTSRYLAGAIDEVAVYPTALAATTVSAHTGLGRGTGPVAPVAPVARLSASCTDLVCTADASASSDADGSISSYSFDFGDGSAPRSGSAAKVSHTYAAAGTYTVQVTVTDDTGSTGSASAQVSATAPTAPATGTVLAEDGFERTVADGWGSAPTGGAWSVSGGATNFSVSGGTGNVAVAAAKGPAASLGGVSTTTSDLTVDLTTDKAPTGGGLYVRVIGRSVGTETYRGRVRLLSDGRVAMGLVRASGGTETMLSSETIAPGVTFVPGQRLTTRVQVSGTSPTTVRAKVWPTGSAEPSSWLVSASDTHAALQTAGSVGLAAYLSGTATTTPLTVRFDRFRVGSSSGTTTTPTTPVAPVARLSASCADLVCTADASASSDADGSISSYSFDFGDGSAPRSGSAARVSHTYAAAGTSTVRVTVTDSSGLTSSASAQVSATAPAAPTTGTVLAEDGFARTVSDGWGSAPTGGAWSVSGGATNFSVSGGTGNVLVAAGRSPAASLGGVSTASSDVSVDLTTDKAPSGGGLYVRVIGRSVGTETYRSKVRLLSDGRVAVALVRASGGTETLLSSETVVPGIAFVPGQQLTVRMQASGTSPTTVRAKLWATGSTEPSSWLVSASDTHAALQTAGSVGLAGYLSGTATITPLTVRFDRFRVGSS